MNIAGMTSNTEESEEIEAEQEISEKVESEEKDQ